MTASLSDALSEDCSVRLCTTAAATEEVDSAEQLGRLLQREAGRALQTHDMWARSPHAGWVRTLLGELGEAHRGALLARQRRIQTTAADDFGTRWELGADFAGLVVQRWLGVEGRCLKDVLAKSDAFGHSKLRSGIILSGR